MSGRRIANISSDEVEHISNGFGKMGTYRGTYRNGYARSSAKSEWSRNGWDSDEDEVKEEDLWGEQQGSTSTWDHSSHQRCNGSSSVWNHHLAENGCSNERRKDRKSGLSMELRAVDDATGVKKNEHVGVGFAALEAVQSGGWAPGFSVRKVKIPQYMMGGGGGYGNGWHEEENGGNLCGGVPQSAPVSMPVWPMKRGCGASNIAADVDDSSAAGEGDGVDDDGSDEDDDTDKDFRGRRLAPHEIVDRDYARSQSTTFSVIEGAGRTLKGMDLRRVRNAVWSRMGFED